MEIVQTFNEVYEPVFTSSARYIDIWGGRGRGGSHFGTEYFLHLITKPDYFRGYFVRQAFKDIRDSLFTDLKDRIKENDTLNLDDFHINENEMRVLYKPTGNIINSKGVKADNERTAKMKSLAGATHVLIEEADEVGETDFDQLDLSIRTTKSSQIQIMRIFNPPGKTHWIWRDYILTDAHVMDEKAQIVKGYFTAQPKKDSNLISLFSTYHDNRQNLQDSTVDKFEAFKPKKPEYYYTIIKGLISEGMKGRIFSGWNSMTDQQFLEIDARSIWGQDFGSASPAALIEGKIVNNRLYIREHNYEGMTEKQLGLLYCKLGIKEDTIIADSAEPMAIRRLRNGWSIDELSNEERADYALWKAEFDKYKGNPKDFPPWKYAQILQGWSIFPAFKGPGSINAGVKKVKDYEVFVTEESTNIWFEYREYRWALDRYKNPLDEPEDANNHACDAIRMIISGKGRYY